jgi:quercetin dioxygenase-like cupin family protein
MHVWGGALVEAVFENQLRRFIAEDAIRNVISGTWVKMYDDTGAELPGIRGRIGSVLRGIDGEEIGADLMEIAPGCGFPLHTHNGDHILFVYRGTGMAVIDGKEYRLVEGDCIAVPAERPHAFSNPAPSAEPWIIIAFGHPHRHLSAVDRLKLVRS